MLTTSPTTGLPSVRRMPLASRLLPPPQSAACAPSSTTRTPAGRWKNAIQRFRLSSLPVLGRKIVPPAPDNAVGQQRFQCVAGVKMPFAVLEVVVREEDLRNAEAVFAERGIVERHQFPLPNRGGGLEFVQLFGTHLEAEFSHAGSNRARRH